MGEKEENLKVIGERDRREREMGGSRLKACMELLEVIFQVESWSDYKNN